MANEGILANATITAFAAAAYLYLAFEVRRRRRATQDGRTLAGLLFFAIVGVHLLLAAARQLVAYVGQADPAIARLEEPIFYVAAAPAAFATCPSRTWPPTRSPGATASR